MERHCQKPELSVTDLQNNPGILDSAHKNSNQYISETRFVYNP